MEEMPQTMEEMPQTMEEMPKKKSVYNKERCEQNKEEILQYRRGRYRTIHKKDLNTKASTGTFTLYLIKFFLCIQYTNVCN